MSIELSSEVEVTVTDGPFRPEVFAADTWFVDGLGALHLQNMPEAEVPGSRADAPSIRVASPTPVASFGPGRWASVRRRTAPQA